MMVISAGSAPHALSAAAIAVKSRMWWIAQITARSENADGPMAADWVEVRGIAEAICSISCADSAPDSKASIAVTSIGRCTGTHFPLHCRSVAPVNEALDPGTCPE